MATQEEYVEGLVLIEHCLTQMGLQFRKDSSGIRLLPSNLVYPNVISGGLIVQIGKLNPNEWLSTEWYPLSFPTDTSPKELAERVIRFAGLLPQAYFLPVAIALDKFDNL